MSKVKLILAVLISLLPFNDLRVLGYCFLLGYKIQGARIGFGTVLAVDEASLQPCKIGLFNLFIGPMKVIIEKNASIGNRNTFSCGYWVLQKESESHNYGRTLEIGENTLITSSHFFDVAGKFKMGERSWIAGIGSQFWTHGAGVRERDIEIGADCYVGSAARFAPGSAIGNNVIVAMGSVVSSAIKMDNALIGGVPAKVIKESYDWKSQNE